MKAIYKSDNRTDVVIKSAIADAAWVYPGDMRINPGTMRCEVADTGNGFIAYFPSHTSHSQDYYVCLDYSQARDLVLGLSMFKKELGFEDD